MYNVFGAKRAGEGGDCIKDMNNCDFRLPILCFYPSKHHPKPLSVLHALREDARVDVEARAGRVGHV